MKSQSLSIPSRLVTPNTLRHLGNVYESASAVIAEFVDNSADAEATKIWIVLEPDKISIIDNGQGMVPDMLKEDRELLDMYIEDIQHPTKSKGLDDFDIRQEISPISLKSLRWMVSYGAFSSKKHLEGSDVRGVKGIGAIAFRQIANEAVWLTKPNFDLAESYFGKEVRDDDFPVAKLEPPTDEQLSKHDIRNKISWPVAEPLCDPRGNKLESGTILKITKLKEGVIKKSLKPAVLAHYLGGRFGSDIKSKRFELMVVDRITRGWKKKDPSGMFTHVQQSSYPGVLIVERIGHLQRGQYPFAMEFYYNPRGIKDLRPKIRRRKSEVNDLTVIEELDVFPWNSGKVGGFVDFPNIPESEAPWTSDKTIPLHSASLNRWVKCLENIADDVVQRIEEIQEKAKETSRRQITSMVQKSAREAMLNLTPFSELALLARTPSKVAVARRRESRKKVKRIEERTTAQVYNEHRQGVQDVEMELISEGESIRRKVTGISGKVTFGVLIQARYTIGLVDIPEGVRIVGESKRVFNIGPNQPGVDVVFELETGDPKPEQKRISGIKLWPHELDDPNQPYNIERMHVGVLELNTGSARYAEAIDAGDEQGQILLESLYTSMGVTEYALEGNTRYMMAQVANLFSEIFSIATSRHEGLRRRRRKR